MYFYTLLINQGVRKVLTSALKQEANWHVICTIRCRSSVTSLVLKNMWTYACHLPQYPIPDVYFTSMTDKCTTMKLRNRAQMKKQAETTTGSLVIYVGITPPLGSRLPESKHQNTEQWWKSTCDQKLPVATTKSEDQTVVNTAESQTCR